MIKEFPLHDVTIIKSSSVSNVSRPAYISGGMLASQDEFSLQVPGVGSFYVSAGKVVELCPEPGADGGWVQLYLNGQVLVALLHQRKIITFHASSFIHEGRGVMVLGESGAGKSSLTAAFALDGAQLLTDDVTPVIFRSTVPHVWPLHGEIRIRRNTAEQLNVRAERLREAETGTDRQYLHVGNAGVKYFPLHIILKVEAGNVSQPVFDEPSPTEKFTLLRSEICMSEILAGMPETEQAYLHQLLEVARKVTIVRVVRPAEIKISDLHDAIKSYFNQDF